MTGLYLKYFKHNESQKKPPSFCFALLHLRIHCAHFRSYLYRSKRSRIFAYKFNPTPPAGMITKNGMRKSLRVEFHIGYQINPYIYIYIGRNLQFYIFRWVWVKSHIGLLNILHDIRVSYYLSYLSSRQAQICNLWSLKTPTGLEHINLNME